MSVLRGAIALAAGAAIVLVSARVASCDDGPAKTAPGASERLAWDEPLDGPRLAGAPQFADDFPPSGPPRGSDRDLPPPRDRHGEADRQPGPGEPRDGDRGGPPPRDGDRDRPPPRDGQGRDARPGNDHQPPGPPRDRNARPGEERPPQPPAPPRDREGRPGQPPNDGRFGQERFLPDNDPEMAKLMKADMELSRQTHELAMQCRQASKEQTAEMKKQLQELVNKQFDVRQERRNLELKRLDTEIQRLREAIDRRSKAKDKIVDQRVSDLLGVEGELSF